MEDTVCIEQQGTVEEVNGHKVLIRIRQLSACGNCHARSFCTLSEMKDKTIEADDSSLVLSAGDTVTVMMKRSMGNKAVLLGYVLPLFLLMITLLLFNALTKEEWIAGFISVAVLLPYYFTLYLLRDRLSNTFTFTLRKPD
ncbi:MAG: SoxR reducing system RseC family protein [Bacteroidales bacterium]|nr:SoxR reducing system RseC family protein [Bacteroidales bacterium]